MSIVNFFPEIIFCEKIPRIGQKMSIWGQYLEKRGLFNSLIYKVTDHRASLILGGDGSHLPQWSVWNII